MEINQIIQGDALEVLKTFPDDFVDTIITSPPYWGLRDYGIEGQIGLEKTLDEYLEKLLAITNELKRVLKKTGVMFWNHGDCYGGSGAGTWSKADTHKCKESYVIPFGKQRTNQLRGTKYEKCLMFQNYRLILRVIDQQGWILRNTIIWHKPNHMPSSVKDRFSNAYEPVFMLTKNKKYWFDLDAVRKLSGTYEAFNLRVRDVKRGHKTKSGQYRASEKEVEQYHGQDIQYSIKGKNPGDVWKIATQPFPEAHFATFPEKLIYPMIKSSCPKEICKKCGKARVRITKVDYKVRAVRAETEKHFDTSESGAKPNLPFMGNKNIETSGWTDCKCGKGFEPGIVLDPFIGSGTVALVAQKLKRNWLGIELNPAYIKIAGERLKQGVLI